MIELVSPSGVLVKTRKRTVRAVLSAWASGTIPIQSGDWVGTRIMRDGILIGTVDDFGWSPC